MIYFFHQSKKQFRSLVSQCAVVSFNSLPPPSKFRWPSHQHWPFSVFLVDLTKSSAWLYPPAASMAPFSKLFISYSSITITTSTTTIQEFICYLIYSFVIMARFSEWKKKLKSLREITGWKSHFRNKENWKKALPPENKGVKTLGLDPEQKNKGENRKTGWR